MISDDELPPPPPMTEEEKENFFMKRVRYYCFRRPEYLAMTRCILTHWEDGFQNYLHEIHSFYWYEAHAHYVPMEKWAKKKLVPRLAEDQTFTKRMWDELARCEKMPESPDYAKRKRLAGVCDVYEYPWEVATEETEVNGDSGNWSNEQASYEDSCMDDASFKESSRNEKVTMTLPSMPMKHRRHSMNMDDLRMHFDAMSFQDLID